MTDIHKALALVRTVFCIILLAVSPAMASDATYTIEGVEVDVTAENAVEAREKAFEEAQVKAFEVLAERLLSEAEIEVYDIPDLDTISGFVQDFEVTNEQLSAIRYKGTYTFRFRSGAIQGHMSQADQSYSETPAEPILVLPYMQQGTRTVLWENNPFMEAWTKMAVSSNGKNRALVPLGDLLDISQIKDDPALRYDKMSLDNMVGRYQASEAIILIAEPQADKSLTVSMYSTKTTIPTFLKSIEVPAKPGMPDYVTYQDAVSDVKAALRQDWKEKTKIQNPAQASSLKARARFSNVQEWVNLKRSIESVSGVNSVRVQGLKPKEAIIRIEFSGTEERLIPAFAHVGLVLDAPFEPSAYNAQLPGEKIYDIRLDNGGRY